MRLEVKVYFVKDNTGEEGVHWEWANPGCLPGCLPELDQIRFLWDIWGIFDEKK